MPLAFHSIRQKLRDKRPLIGVFCELPCPESVEIIGLAGWDFLVIDCEHAPITAAQLPGLGIPGEVSHPRVFAAAEQIMRSAEARGVVVGVFTNSEQDARRWLEIGVRYLCLSVDTVYLLNAMRAAVTTFR